MIYSNRFYGFIPFIFCTVIANSIIFVQSQFLSMSDTIMGMDYPSQTSLNRDVLENRGDHNSAIGLDGNQAHSRKKRLVWVTDDGRLALPPGTTLTFTPTIALPLVRHPPEGFFSNMSISFPVTIDFDKLGLTDNQNPLGDLPPLLARSFGHTAGKVLSEYMSQYIRHKSKRELRHNENSYFQIKRNINTDEAIKSDFPHLPENLKNAFHGGERVLLYGALEDFISTFGMDGKPCLLRFICEIHSRRIDKFGILGEITKLVLTATKSPFSNLIPEYVRAQEIGEGRQAPGECFPYHKDCPKSIFKSLQNHNYREYGGDIYGTEGKEMTKHKFRSQLNFGRNSKEPIEKHNTKNFFVM